MKLVRLRETSDSPIYSSLVISVGNGGTFGARAPHFLKTTKVPFLKKKEMSFYNEVKRISLSPLA